MADAVSVIAAKRDGNILDSDQIAWMVDALSLIHI